MADIFVAPKQPPADIKSDLAGREEIRKAPASHPVNHVLKDSAEVKILSTFCENPKGISFQAQKPNESIILFLRAHLITNLPWVLIAIFLIILPIIILFVLPMLNINIFSFPNAIRYVATYLLFYYLIVFSYVFVNSLHWFYYIFMVTTQRVVDVDYSDVVVHNVAVTSLSQIQDVKYTQYGFISTFFNYGDIFIQTAGTQVNFEEFSIPKPRKATHIIAEVIGKKPMKAFV